MTIIIMIGCVILWAALQVSLGRTGGTRSRSSMRYQRRQARKLGIAPEALDIHPRYGHPGDLDETRAKVDRFARRWLLIPTLIMAAMLLWPFIEKLWK